MSVRRRLSMTAALLGGLLVFDGAALAQRGRDIGSGRGSSITQSRGSITQSRGSVGTQSRGSVSRPQSPPSRSSVTSRPSTGSSYRSTTTSRPDVSTTRSSVPRSSTTGSSTSVGGSTARTINPTVRYVPADSAPSQGRTTTGIDRGTRTAPSTGDWRSRPLDDGSRTIPERGQVIDLGPAPPATPRAQFPRLSGSRTDALQRPSVPGTRVPGARDTADSPRVDFRSRPVTREDILERYRGGPEREVSERRGELADLPLLSRERRPATEDRTRVDSARRQRELESRELESARGRELSDARRERGELLDARGGSADAREQGLGSRLAGDSERTRGMFDAPPVREARRRLGDVARVDPERAQKIRRRGELVGRAAEAGVRTASAALVGVVTGTSCGLLGGPPVHHWNSFRYGFWFGHGWPGWAFGYSPFWRACGFGYLGWGWSWGWNWYWYDCGYWWYYPRTYVCYRPFYSAVVYQTIVREVPVYYETTAPAEPVEEVVVEAQPGEAVVGAPSPNPELVDSLNRAADYYLVLGDRAFREGRFGDAVHFYAKAVEFGGEEGVLYLILSDALFATGDYHYAAYALRRALELDPALASSVVDKRSFYSDPADFDRQLAVLERYLDDHFLDDDARLVLAANYLFGGRPAAAVDLLASSFSLEVRESPAGAILLDSAQALQYGTPR